MASTEFMESVYPVLLDRRGVLRLTETASTGRGRTYARVQDPRRDACSDGPRPALRSVSRSNFAVS
jgi:hypothetical protein